MDLPRKRFRSRLAWLLAALLVGGMWRGTTGDLKLSFLDDPRTLEDTCRLLERHGISKEAVAAFKRVVEFHNKEGNPVDRSRFPIKRGGYYRFSSVEDFTRRLARPLYATPGPALTLTCFDVACLLLRGAGRKAGSLEKGFESKGIVRVTDDGRAQAVTYEEFRSGFGLLMPAKGYELFVGKPRDEMETRLGLVLRAARRLSGSLSASREGLEKAFEQYVRRVREDGFEFPRKFKLGLGFYVNLRSRYIVADHAFICMPEGGRLVCVEKNGSPGPYVRAEFESPADLARYVSWSLLEAAKDPKVKERGNSVLVSLNEELIGVFPSRATPKQRKAFFRKD